MTFHSHSGPNKFKLHYGDLSDSTNLVYIIASVQPTEVYNLGAQSHVKVSFEMAEYTGDVDGLGTFSDYGAINTMSTLPPDYGMKSNYVSSDAGCFYSDPLIIRDGANMYLARYVEGISKRV